MEPEKLRDEYIKIFEEKKQIEHDYLIVLEKLGRLEDTEKAHHENLIQYEGIVEKAKQMNDEIINLKERIRQIGEENIQLISLNNQYIEAIETFHSETGNAKSRVLNENTKLRKMERDLAKAKKKINDLERYIEETKEQVLKEREERVFIEKQYEDYIYDQENALANMKIESEKIMRENLIDKFLELNQNPNTLNFFYNEQTNKIEIFFEDEKIFDMENAKPTEKIDEKYNNSINRDIDNQNYTDKNPIKKNEIEKNLILRTKRYSFDGNSKVKRAKLSDISSSNIDSDEENKREFNIDSDNEENKRQLQSSRINKNNEREAVNEVIDDNNVSYNPPRIFTNKDEKVQTATGNLVENCEINENSLITKDNEYNLLEHKINEIYNTPNGHDDTVSNPDNQQNSVYVKKLRPSKRSSLNSFIRRKNDNYFKRRNKNSKSISFGNVKENDLQKFFTDNNLINNQNIDNKDYKIIDGNSNNNTPKIVKTSSQTNTNNDSSFKKSYNRLFKRHSLAFNSFNNSEKLLFNVKNRLFNSDHVQKFVLENLNVDEKIEDQAKNNDDINPNKVNELNIFNNNLDNPLFKSTNSSFIHDASFNSKAVRRTTINNFNIISNKLSNVADNEKDLANEINDLASKRENEELDDINISRQSVDLHNDSYRNIKPNNHLNEENNFILEDLIEEDKLITERNEDKNDFNNNDNNNQRRLSSIDDARSFNLLNDNSEDHNNEKRRKDSSQVNLIIDELEIDHFPIEDNNLIRNPEKEKVEDVFISNDHHRDMDLIKTTHKCDFENEKVIRNVVEDKIEDPKKIRKLKARDSKLNRKPDKKHHRKSLSNINLSTFDLETLTREKKESSKYILNLNEEKTLIDKKHDHGYNENLRKISNVIIENVDSANISKNDNHSDWDPKEKNKVSSVCHDVEFNKKLTLKTPNYDHPKNHDAEVNVYKNLKEGIYLESNKANLRTNFKSDLKEEEEEESFDASKNHFLQTRQKHRKTFISNKSDIDIEPKKYSRPKSFIDCKNKTSSNDYLKEIEKCIKDINLDTFFKNENQDKFSETNYKNYKKSFDSSDVKKKILDQFKLPKINNIRDRVLSTNITTNNHYWKYTINLVPSNDSSFVNSQKANNYSKNLKPKENINQTSQLNCDTKDYDPAIIEDPNKYFVNKRNKFDNYTDLHDNMNKSNLSFNKFNLNSEKSDNDKSPKTYKLQSLFNKFLYKRKSSFLKDNNIIKSNNRGFTGISIDNQIDDFCILSNKKKKEKADKMCHYRNRVENFDKSQNKDYMIILHNDPNINQIENDNHIPLNSSLDGSSSNSSYNGIDEDMDLNKAYIAGRQSSKSFHKKEGEVHLTNNRDFQILDVEK